MFRAGVTIWYNVSDLQATLDFYNNKLGFETTFHEAESGMAMVRTTTADCIIGFSEAQEVEASTSSTVFEVYDIDGARRQLEQKGVVFIGETETVPGMAKLATFVDPDGHSLMLSEELGLS